MWQAVEATSAAPSIFPRTRLGGRSFADGGLVANNPTLIALREARALWPHRRIGVVVSLGTGSSRPASTTAVPEAVAELAPGGEEPRCRRETAERLRSCEPERRRRYAVDIPPLLFGALVSSSSMRRRLVLPDRAAVERRLDDRERRGHARSRRRRRPVQTHSPVSGSYLGQVAADGGGDAALPAQLAGGARALPDAGLPAVVGPDRRRGLRGARVVPRPLPSDGLVTMRPAGSGR